MRAGLTGGGVSGRMSSPHQPIADHAGDLFPIRRPVGGQRQIGVIPFRFQIDPAAVGQPAAGFQRRADRRQQPLPERRIEQHDVEWSSRLAQPGQRFGHLDSRVSGLQPGQIGVQGTDRNRVLFDQHRLRRPARQGFETERAAAGEQIQATRAGQDRSQPVEQGFANPVRSRAQPRQVGKFQLTGAPLAGDDAERMGSMVVVPGHGAIR